MPSLKDSLQTADGTCPVQLFTPAGQGSWPAVIFYMDALGIRPAIEQMAQRLADHGYAVLLPDLFYRYGPYPVMVPEEVFRGDGKAVFGPLMATTGVGPAVKDSEAFLRWLAARPEVAQGPVGTVGFCMGGGMATAAAGAYPEQIGAAASFHAGGLATGAQDSPHRYVPGTKAEVYVAAAEGDPFCPAEMVAEYGQALARAGVPYRTEIYPGVHHGWMKPDFPIYDEDAAERGWAEMLDLFHRRLQ